MTNSLSADYADYTDYFQRQKSEARSQKPEERQEDSSENSERAESTEKAEYTEKTEAIERTEKSEFSGLSPAPQCSASVKSPQPADRVPVLHSPLPTPHSHFVSEKGLEFSASCSILLPRC
jgi:hypothetical protein